jgi:P-type Ca2+ transporter type 2C
LKERAEGNDHESKEKRKDIKQNLNKSWSVPSEEVIKEIQVDPEKGLSEEEVQSRREKYGKNMLRKIKGRSWLMILLEQFKSVIMLLLFGAMLLSFTFTQWIDGIAIGIAILINALIGFFTEMKAEQSIKSLQQMDKVTCKVRRNGEAMEIPAEEVVPGDILLIESGDLIPADVRLFEASKLQTNESALTGESVPQSKNTEPVQEDASLADRSNMLYKGTAVTRGTGEGVVIATGMNTEIGTISSLVEESGSKSDPIEKQMDKLSGRLIWVILIISVVAGISGFVGGKALLLMIKTTVALIVAAIPEGLAVVATIAFATGMKRMASQNALVRRLSAVQTLGSTNIIFSDKTGTLTENKMTVNRIQTDDGDISYREKLGDEKTEDHLSEKPLVRQAIEIGVLCNNAELPDEEEEKEEAELGDPMEVALLSAGQKIGMTREDLLENQPEVREVSFDPEVKMMATYHKMKDDRIKVAVKGAPQAVLNVCNSIAGVDVEKQMTQEEKDKWLKVNDEMGEDGLRILAMATKTVDNEDTEPYQNLKFLGLVGLFDPPKDNIKDVIDQCKKAGVRVIMITGDQITTAKNVGLAVNLIENESASIVKGDEVKDLEDLSKDEKERLLKTNIFARTSPEQKLNLISLHQEADSIVAMTGDGVNDAPALKKADIGVAMGKRGEQVAKESADIILQDDAFSTIVLAIKYGRIVFNNIRKFVLYLLSGNIAEIIIVGIAALLGTPLPLLPLQILYLNAINDVFPALALGMGEKYDKIMNKRYLTKDEPIMTRKYWILIFVYGGLLAGVVLAVFFIGWNVFGLSDTEANTMAFLCIAFSRLWHVFNMRESSSKLIFNEVSRNTKVWGALLLCSVLIVFAVFMPGLSDVLEVSTIDSSYWLFMLGMSFIPLVVGQLGLTIYDRIESRD